jgi:hypothetical protein
MEMSRRTMLKAAAAATGVALTGTYTLAGEALATTLAPATTARVGATVAPLAYPKGTTWDQAMATFNSQVGRNFEVAKRYYKGASTWPTASDLGVGITSLIQRGCRGLLCFEPNPDGSDLTALKNSLKAIKQAGLTDAKVTLWDEQGLGSHLSAAEFRAAFKNYQAIRDIYPLWVDFAGSAASTWTAYYPGAGQLDGIAVDFYASVFVNQGRIDPLAALADEAGLAFGIWEIGNTSNPSAKLPSPDQVGAYFRYLTHLQSTRLKAGHQVGDMAWYNGPHLGSWNNTISGTKLSPRTYTDRKQLDTFFDSFNGAK